MRIPMQDLSSYISSALLYFSAHTFHNILSRVRQNDKTLTHLDLSSMNLSERHVIALCNTLRQSGNTALISLNINLIHITLAGIKALAETQSILMLSANACDITDEGFAVLMKNEHFLYLSLRYNKLGVSQNGLFINNRNLQHLELSGNKIHSIHGLESHRALHSLNLSENRINDVTAQNIFRNEKILFLDLRLNSIKKAVTITSLLERQNSVFLDLRSNPAITGDLHDMVDARYQSHPEWKQFTISRDAAHDDLLTEEDPLLSSIECN